MDSNTCKTCKWWGEIQKRYGDGSEYAACECPKLDHRYGGNDPDGAVDAEEYGGIFTGPDFGCIHHEPKDD
jgi:hypothetical protein